jgi:hypothetical protein
VGSLIKELLRLVRSAKGNDKGKVEGMVKYAPSKLRDADTGGCERR